MYQDAYRPHTQFSAFPPVVKNLLIINFLFFLAQQTPGLGDWLMEWLALWPVGTPEVARTSGGGVMAVPDFQIWQLVTYGFLHGDIMHILFNMFAFWMFGMQIENTWGSQKFAFYYFVCVIGAGLVQLVVASTYHEIYPTIGASGGVFGVLLAFGMLFPNQPIYLYFLFPIKAKWFVIGYGVLELYAGISGSMPGVANFAHLGGMVFGLILILYWRGKLPLKPAQRSW